MKNEQAPAAAFTKSLVSCLTRMQTSKRTKPGTGMLLHAIRVNKLQIVCRIVEGNPANLALSPPQLVEEPTLRNRNLIATLEPIDRKAIQQERDEYKTRAFEHSQRLVDYVYEKANALGLNGPAHVTVEVSKKVSLLEVRRAAGKLVDFYWHISDPVPSDPERLAVRDNKKAVGILTSRPR